MNHPQQDAQNLLFDLADVIRDVSRLAAQREARHLLFVLDRDNPTALELVTEYAPLGVQLARDGVDDVDVIALSRADGLNLLRAPKHHSTIFRIVADQIEAAESASPEGICISGQGFVRFTVTRMGVLH